MPSSCVVFGCKSGYDSEASSSSNDGSISSFTFPFKKPELLEKWVKFVNRANWEPQPRSVICIKHFKEEFIVRGKVRNCLKWQLQPVPTIHTATALKRPSTLVDSSSLKVRKTPKDRPYQKDELNDFVSRDTIKSFEEIDTRHAPAGYHVHNGSGFVVFYNLMFNENTGFPKVYEAIRIDQSLHVKLQFCANDVPLPAWFTKGRNATLTRYSMLENFSAYLRGFSDSQNDILEEMSNRQHFKAKGQTPYSSNFVRFALLLRYTSAQAYSVIEEHLPVPSTSLLRKLRQGNVDTLKAARLLKEINALSKDVVLLCDEMYLRKSVQYSNGKYLGAGEDGTPYKGIVVFMIRGLKESVSIVLKACPETSLKGTWLAKEMVNCIFALAQAGFNVRAIVTDNHACNVNAFHELKAFYPCDSSLAIHHPCNLTKTYLFFDNVHIIKNIRNNLLNVKKFVFPAFSFQIGKDTVTSDNGYIMWSDLKCIYDHDSELSANLRKAHKLTFRALNPFNNKQNVNLTLAIFHDTTIAASKCYLPQRHDMHAFLMVVSTWWTVVNSKHRYCAHELANAFVNGDGKPEFLFSFAGWLEKWCSSRCRLCLSKQTFDALITTLRAQAHLILDLLAEGYDFVVPSKLQSDPLEKRFSQYRQMSGGNFLVSLREVLDTEKTLICRSLLKENVNIWQEDVLQQNDSLSQDALESLQNLILDVDVDELSLSADSEDVAVTIAGYIAKKLMKKYSCQTCNDALTEKSTAIVYFQRLSRGNLTIPSACLSDFVCKVFALLDHYDDKLLHLSGCIRQAASYVLQQHLNHNAFACALHQNNASRLAIKIIANIFYNNKQRLTNDATVKDTNLGFKKRQRAKE